MMQQRLIWTLPDTLVSEDVTYVGGLIAAPEYRTTNIQQRMTTVGSFLQFQRQVQQDECHHT